MLAIRRKVVYILFALLAVGLLVGGPTTTVFAGCEGANGSSCE